MVICNNRGMINCDTVSINIDDNNQNNFSQPKSKINSPVNMNSQETTGHIISRLFQKDADTQTPQNFNEGMNSLESGKLSELRQKELKLSKLEKDLSLREKLLNENSKDRTHLETYTMKLEACNQELEQTVRTLKRKIEILEDQADGVTPPIDSNLIKKANPSQNNNSALENQLQKINDRVATFVLNQIDLQLNKLDGNMNLEENLLVTGNKNSQKNCPPEANTPNLQGDVGLSPSKKRRFTQPVTSTNSTAHQN